MSLTANWITQALQIIGCKGNGLTQFEHRKFDLAMKLELLNEVDPGSLVTNDLASIYTRIKCGGNSNVTIYEVMRAESLIAREMLNLSKVEPITVYGSGTAYALTATAAAVNLGTTDPVIVLNKAGKYKISARLQIRLNGATFASSREVISKLRRTNNTAADITSGTTTIPTGITTTQTGLLAIVTIPDVVYETALENDSVTIFSSVAVLPSAGTIEVTEASIFAQRIGI